MCKIRLQRKFDRVYHSASIDRNSSARLRSESVKYRTQFSHAIPPYRNHKCNPCVISSRLPIFPSIPVYGNDDHLAKNITPPRCFPFASAARSPESFRSFEHRPCSASKKEKKEGKKKATSLFIVVRFFPPLQPCILATRLGDKFISKFHRSYVRRWIDFRIVGKKWKEMFRDVGGRKKKRTIRKNGVELVVKCAFLRPLVTAGNRAKDDTVERVGEPDPQIWRRRSLTRVISQ